MGTKVWGSGLLLASWLEKGARNAAARPTHRLTHHAHHAVKGHKNQRVLEIGAGCGGMNGFVFRACSRSTGATQNAKRKHTDQHRRTRRRSIALARQGALVTWTDQAPVLSLLRENLALNLPDATTAFDVRELDWQSTDLAAFKRVKWDVIVASDVVFKNASTDALLAALHALADDSTRIYVGEELREPAVHEHFLAAASTLFELKAIPRAKFVTNGDARLEEEREFVLLWTLRRRKAAPTIDNESTNVENVDKDIVDAPRGDA